MSNLNVLSHRYASQQMNQLFSQQERITRERRFWLLVLEIQKELGLDVSDDEIQRFQQAVDKVDQDRIREIETITRHDVKARLEAFIEASGGGGHLHLGLTSRDVTDNVEQVIFRDGGRLLTGRFAAVLNQMLVLAKKFRDLVITGRTHHQPAQPTTLGKRFGQWAAELLFHLKEFELFLDRYPLRGIKGPVGTCQDMEAILGSPEKARQLERKLAERLGFVHLLDAVGQVYYRSLDYKMASHISALCTPCQSMAQSIRLMAGLGLVTEGFREGQTGSSAMPHKMNCRTSERIWGMANLVKMYAAGLGTISGGQWEEGDVSCSVVRRVIMPDLFYAADGLCRAVLTVLKEFGPYPGAIDDELSRYLPFLATTGILSLAVSRGVDRETAHEIIKKAAIAEALRTRNNPGKPDITTILANDPVFAQKEITADDIEEVIGKTSAETGFACEQVDSIIKAAAPLLVRHPKAAQYSPGEIL